MTVKNTSLPILILLIIALNINLPILAKVHITTDTLSVPQNKKEYRSWLKTFERSKSGLYHKTIIQGSGKTPKAGDLVVVNYKGLFKDNTEFDNSANHGRPLEFNVGVGQVIDGWDEAILLMNEGSKLWIIVPPHIGYGSRDNGPIPANSTLYFEIELLKVVPQMPIEPFKIDKKNLKITKSGIKYAFIEDNDGVKPDSNCIVTFHYTGYLPNGKIFSSSKLSDEPEKLTVGTISAIKGLNEALMLMSQGSKARFVIPSALAYGEKGYYTLIPPNTDLTYDIEMMEVKQPPVITPYISDNDTITLENGLKYIPFRTTNDKQPTSGSIVGIHYTGYFEDGKIFDSSVLRDQHIMFVVDEGHVIPGMNEAIKEMHIGEKARILIPWNLAYGEEGNPPVIAPKTNLIFDIELLFIANQ